MRISLKILANNKTRKIHIFFLLNNKLPAWRFSELGDAVSMWFATSADILRWIYKNEHDMLHSRACRDNLKNAFSVVIVLLSAKESFKWTAQGVTDIYKFWMRLFCINIFLLNSISRQKASFSFNISRISNPPRTQTLNSTSTDFMLTEWLTHDERK